MQTVSEFRLEFTDAGSLSIAGVLITRADRTLVSKQIESEVRAYFGRLVYEHVVPVSVKFREAYARGTPLIHYDRFTQGQKRTVQRLKHILPAVNHRSSDPPADPTVIQ